LAGLPPTFLATGALDLFVEEDLEYGRRLIRAGVPVELHLYPGAYHGFDVNVGAPVVAALERDSRAALVRALAPTS
jgi:acetyl esterase/lipase